MPLRPPVRAWRGPPQRRPGRSPAPTRPSSAAMTGARVRAGSCWEHTQGWKGGAEFSFLAARRNVVFAEEGDEAHAADVCERELLRREGLRSGHRAGKGRGRSQGHVNVKRGCSKRGLRTRPATPGPQRPGSVQSGGCPRLRTSNGGKWACPPTGKWKTAAMLAAEWVAALRPLRSAVSICSVKLDSCPSSCKEPARNGCDDVSVQLSGWLSGNWIFVTSPHRHPQLPPMHEETCGIDCEFSCQRAHVAGRARGGATRKQPLSG